MSSGSGFANLLTFPLRVLRFAVGAALVTGALLLTLVVGLSLLLWAVLRGKRPQLGQSFVWRGTSGAGTTGFNPFQPAQRTSRDAGEVVDVQAIEVADAVEPTQAIRR